MVADDLDQFGQCFFEFRFTWVRSLERDEHFLHVAMFVPGVRVRLLHVEFQPEGVHYGFFGEGMKRELETDLVHQCAAVSAAGLQMLEQALHDGVIIGNQMVDITGQSRVGKRRDHQLLE